MNLTRTWILLLMVSAPISRAAQGTTNGRNAKEWQSGYLNVIVAVVRDVHKDRDDPSDHAYRATLVPRATIAGRFDASQSTSLSVKFYVGVTDSSIASPPPPRGAMILAVLAMDVTQGNAAEPAGDILSDICTFMPGRSGLVIIKSIDDPRVSETLKKIRNARADGDPDQSRSTEEENPPATEIKT